MLMVRTADACFVKSSCDVYDCVNSYFVQDDMRKMTTGCRLVNPSFTEILIHFMSAA